MTLTESEARTKWCPFARVLLPVHQSGNRISTFHKANAESERDKEHYAQQERDCCCIASDCMAWRWQGRPVHVPDRDFGYCGLSGKYVD